MTPNPLDAASAYEALMSFVYRAPIGLVQTTHDGGVILLNPMSAQLLMPLAPNGDLSNLFEVLAPIAPQLSDLAALPGPPGSVICDGLRLPLPSLHPQSDGLLATPHPVLSLSLLRLDATTLMASLTDVSLAVQQEAQQAEQRQREARVDRLTGLPNHKAISERIDSALTLGASGTIQAVIATDIDRFGDVNLSLGRETGDKLLRLVAMRIAGTVRARDPDAAALTARLSDDKFAVLIEALPSTDEAHTIANRLVDALNQPYMIDGSRVHAAVSVGIIAGPLAGTAESVMQDAALAMQQARRAGGARCCVYDPALKALASQRANLEIDLRLAIEQNELFVVYQPIVNLSGTEASCGASGVEALVRWRHPRRGIVPPIDFIGIAEETGLIVPLGDFVLRTACAQMVAWKRLLGDAAPPMLSVNLSAAQLAQATIVQQVAAALRDTGLAASRLQLEVTESMAAQDPQVQSRLHDLKALGIRIALDDFGTGYSSLSSLHLMPIDVVKIDRSFVSQLESSSHHRVLVEATVRVARSLDMQTVAEGIETAGQAELLSQLRCDKGQGYLFARPLGAVEATQWLRERAPMSVAA